MQTATGVCEWDELTSAIWQRRNKPRSSMSTTRALSVLAYVRLRHSRRNRPVGRDQRRRHSLGQPSDQLVRHVLAGALEVGKERRDNLGMLARGTRRRGLRSTVHRPKPPVVGGLMWV